MEYFRFVPPTLLVISATVVAMPNPQVLFGGGVGGFPAAPSPSAAPPAAAAPSLPASATRLAPAANTRFLGFGGPRPQQAQPQFQQQQAQTQAQFQQQQAQAQAQFQQQQAQAQAQFQQQQAQAQPQFQQQQAQAQPQFQQQQAQAQPQFQQQQAQAQPQFQQQQQSPQRQQVFGGFGPFIPAVNANNNQGLANLGAGAGLAGVGAFAAGNCLFGQNCDLSFRPSLGASIDANGQIVPQLGVTTQVGDGRGGIGTTFTGGLQLDGNSQNGVGGFVAGGINDGNADGVGLGAQTGFGFSQNAQGSLDATAQIGGNVQAPQLAGVQFNRPNTALGVQPTLLGQARPEFNLFNLFGGR